MSQYCTLERECYCQFDPDKKACIFPMDYVGNGIFKCKKCGLEHNYSEYVYKVRVKILRAHPKILPPFDPRITAEEKGCDTIKEALEEEFLESETFKNHKVGVFDMEVLWRVYRCSYEYNEYDLEFEVLKESPASCVPTVSKEETKQ
jgi:hypothetical protein